MSTRLAQALALRRATVRSVRWPPALAAVALVTVLTTWKPEAFDDRGSATVVLRAIAVLLAVGAVFVMDDSAEISVAAAPTPLWWRRMLRYAVAACFVVPTWVAAVSYAHAQQAQVPWLRLTLELAALVTLGFAVASAAARWWAAIEPGMTAALALLGFTFIAAHLPARLALFTDPGTGIWQLSTLRWAGLLITASLVLAASSRDPGRRRTVTAERAGVILAQR